MSRTSDMPHAEVLIHGISQLVTPSGSAPFRGDDLAAVVTIDKAAIAIDTDGIIVAAASEQEVRESVRIDEQTRQHDAQGALAIPGLVDCHAHLVFGGDRSHEFELRNSGASYEQLHKAGGGIRSTVAATRQSLSDDSMGHRVKTHLDWMLAAGTTTAEGKSGYGLSIDAEVASLEILRDVGAAHALTTTRTALVAHTTPAEYADQADEYLSEVAIPAIERIADANLATAVDIFIERGSFSGDHARKYFSAAAERGLDLRMHGDQFSDQGAIDVALEYGARSIDHLEALAAEDERLKALAASNTAAVLLPLSSLFLRRPYAPGRALVDAGATVALASDFNPGSSYGESLTLAMSLASIGCGLTAAEALTACTANAAWVLRLHDQVGQLRTGFQGDVVLLDQPSLAHVPYHVGSPAIRSVFIRGHEHRRQPA